MFEALKEFSEVISNQYISIIRDLLDISLVSYFIYRLLLLIKGTKAVQLIKGLALIFSFYLLVNYVFQLRTISWLLQNIATFVIISIPIVFQPELRRLLIYIGQEPIISEGKFEKGKDLFDFIKKIVVSVKNLSNKKHGALIIIEKNIGLNEFIETGLKIDAEVSPEILESIFYNGTPLHDGAVIIRNKRIVAASVLLPLSENIKPVSGRHHLGTRHRAGLGLSEVSDAICIIVSEETRDITLAINGKLHRHLTEESLEKLLIDIYQTKQRNTINLSPELLKNTLKMFSNQKEDEKNLKESTQVLEKRKTFDLSFNKSNLFLKLGAIIAGIIFMLVLSNKNVSNSSVDYERSFFIPININYNKIDTKNLKLTTNVSHINLKVSGDKANIDNLTAQELIAFININKTQSEQVLPVSVSLPSGVTIKEVNPKDVLIKMYNNNKT